ncbi:putrescine aminopropyltransferase [Dimargaris xerosporica]|nr:putrescine aminopropyltransferase [Dimargaris xerosporica]
MLDMLMLGGVPVDSVWANQALVSNILTILRDIFPSVGLATASTPCFMTGQLSFVVCSKSPAHDFTVPARTVAADQEAKLFKYYNAALHATCFAHPTFVRRMVRECLGATDVALFQKH